MLNSDTLSVLLVMKEGAFRQGQHLPTQGATALREE